VTAGIVSQTDRWIDESNIEGYETGWFNNWIQTDAAINPGNSGGPLINLKGEVIGINTRGISSGNNLGFAIPIDTAKRVIPELLSPEKKVTRSYIGVSLQPLQDFENHYDIEGNQGVLVSNVDKYSPALAAGLEPGDILMAVDGKPVSGRFPEQISGVRKLIADYPVGAKVQLTIRRLGPAARAAATATAPATSGSAVVYRGESKTLNVTTDKLESVLAEQKAVPAWGMTVRELTHAYLRRASLYQEGKPIQGVLVTSTQVGQPADRAKLLNGDIIISVNDKKVTTIKELTDAVAAWEKNKQNIGVEVIRNRPDASITLSLKP
jgi:serine protease Do